MSSFSKKFKVLGKVGEGSFAEVLKCQERATGVLYAAKRLKKVKESMDEALTTAELRTLEQLKRHPNILYMVEKHVDPLPGKMTIIFELMEMSLYDLIRSRKRPIPEIRCKDYLYQILKGLSHLHRNGIFHRDIKPENILLKGKLVKIADLGSVKGMYQRQPHTEYISTRWYRAPECLLTKGIYGPKMDIWATGCVYYELLTLRPLFPGSNEVDMITKIHNIMGTPSARTISKFKRYRSRNAEYWFPSRAGIGICSMLPNVSEAGRDIFKQMLVYDPDLRSNVRRLLDHRYFNDLRELDESPHRRSCSEDRPPRSPSKAREWRNPMMLSYIADKRKKTKRTITKKHIVAEPPQKLPRVVASNPIQQPSNSRLRPAPHVVQPTVPSHKIPNNKQVVAAHHQKQTEAAALAASLAPPAKLAPKKKYLPQKEEQGTEPVHRNPVPVRLPPIQHHLSDFTSTKQNASMCDEPRLQSLSQDWRKPNLGPERRLDEDRRLPPINPRPPLLPKLSDRMKNEQLVANITKDLFHPISNTNTSIYALEHDPDTNKIKSSRLSLANLPPTSCLRLPPIVPRKTNHGEPTNVQSQPEGGPAVTQSKSFAFPKVYGSLPKRLETIQEQPYQLNRRLNLKCP